MTESSWRVRDIEEYAATVWTYFNTEPVCELPLVDHIEMVVFARQCSFPQATAACLKARREEPVEEVVAVR